MLEPRLAAQGCEVATPLSGHEFEVDLRCVDGVRTVEVDIPPRAQDHRLAVLARREASLLGVHALDWRRERHVQSDDLADACPHVPMAPCADTRELCNGRV